MPDNALIELAKAFESEDALLQNYVEKGRLEMWWKGVTDTAKRSAMDEKDQDGEETKRRMSIERAFLSAMGQKDQDTIRMTEEEVVEMDTQGDVIMED